ncbi:MAG TPA: sulfite exporter TauE/SafE family protein [Hyphomicrobium sp.]|nr:sulfite exporter TauE/SafE family protein [Hyphomicrobium sp.]
MDALALAFAGGLLLGLASALHCASMCGGIASSLLFLFRPDGARGNVTVLAAMQGGRILAYTLAGGIVGLAGSAAFSVINPANAYRVIQWAAAVSLMFIGLTIAGLMPAVAGIDARVARVSETLERTLAPLRRRPVIGPMATGFTWGVSPCPMVYGALFSATLQGTFQGGAAWMLGFGIGTLPAIIASAFGIRALSRLNKGALVRSAVGLTIAAFGFATVYVDWPKLLCLT